MDDATLLAALEGGDHAALKLLFERHAPWLAVRLCRVLPAIAVEDVVQETFIAVWRGSSRFGGQGEPAAWIWGIARRQAALWLRKGGKWELPLDSSGRAAVSDSTERAIHRVDLERALAELGNDGAPDRELLRMVYGENRRIVDVSRALNISAGTVKSRLFTARRRLRAALLGEEF